MPNLIIIRGLPGSGKSTYAKTNYPSYAHVEADQYFIDLHGFYDYRKTDIIPAHNWCYSKVKDLLSKGLNVVVSNTFTRLDFITRYISIPVDFDVSIVEMLNNYGSIHNVPESEMKKMKKAWQEIPSSWLIDVKRVK